MSLIAVHTAFAALAVIVVQTSSHGVDINHILDELVQASRPTKAFGIEATTFERLAPTGAETPGIIAGVGPAVSHARILVGPRGYVLDQTHPLQRATAKRINGGIVVDGIATYIEPDSIRAERIDFHGEDPGLGWSTIGTQMPKYLASIASQSPPEVIQRNSEISISFKSRGIHATIDPARKVVVRVVHDRFAQGNQAIWEALEWQRVVGLEAPYPTVIRWTITDPKGATITDVLQISEFTRETPSPGAFNWWTYTPTAVDETGLEFGASNKAIAASDALAQGTEVDLGVANATRASKALKPRWMRPGVIAGSSAILIASLVAALLAIRAVKRH